MVYRFIDKNKEQFGLRWLCRHFKISLNCYYNYLKDTKRDYYEQRFMVYERIKYIYCLLYTSKTPYNPHKIRLWDVLRRYEKLLKKVLNVYRKKKIAMPQPWQAIAQRFCSISVCRTVLNHKTQCWEESYYGFNANKNKKRWAKCIIH